MRLLKVIRSDDFCLADIVEVVESDVSAAATVMAAANTAATRGVNEVTSVRDAVTRLGAQATRDRVMHQAMQSAFQPRHPALAGLLSKEWALAAQVASVLRRVSCAEIGLEDADTAFTIGLFHNVGMVPLLSAAPALVNIGSSADYYVAARHHASALGGVLAWLGRLGSGSHHAPNLRPAYGSQCGAGSGDPGGRHSCSAGSAAHGGHCGLDSGTGRGCARRRLSRHVCSRGRILG